MAVCDIPELLVSFGLGRLGLSPEDFGHASRLIELFKRALSLRPGPLQLSPMARFHVPCDLHPEDVGVHRKSHPALELLQLPLLALDSPSEIGHAPLLLKLKLLPCLYFLAESALSLRQPDPHGLVMLFVVLVKGGDLVSLAELEIQLPLKNLERLDQGLVFFGQVMVGGFHDD